MTSKICGVRKERLSQRIKSLNSEIQSDRTQDSNSLDQKLERFESKLNHQSQIFEQKTELALHSLEKIEESLNSCKISRGFLSDQIQKKQEILFNHIENDLNSMSHDTHKFSKKIERLVDEHSSVLKLKINKESKSRESSSELYLQRLDQTIRSIENVIEKEQKERARNSTEIEETIEKEFEKFSNELQSNAVEREKNFAKLGNEFIGFEKTLNDMLNKEKQDRFKAKDSLLAILGDMCKKIERNSKE